MAYLDAIVQIRAVNGEAARFERPVGPLFWGGVGQPFQPRHFDERQTDFPAIVKTDVQGSRRYARALGADLFCCFSGQSIHICVTARAVR